MQLLLQFEFLDFESLNEHLQREFGLKRLFGLEHFIASFGDRDFIEVHFDLVEGSSLGGEQGKAQKCEGSGLKGHLGFQL